MRAALDVSAISITRKSRLIDALATLERTRLGLLLLVDEEGLFERTVTDGDLRRLLLHGAANERPLDILPRQQSHVIISGCTARAALELMQRTGINHLPVIDGAGRVVDVIERAAVDQQILLSTPHMGEEEREFVEEAFRTNWIAPLGPSVDAFEREVAEKVGAKHAVALTSGTAAIHLGLVLLNVGPGDIVFCSSLTFVASVNPILYQGAEPVLIDSEPQSWNMSPAALERAFEWAMAANKLPKAVIVVSLYGQSADMDPIREICEAYGVPILEDAAEALGALYKRKPAGTLGDIGIFSFNGNKIITTSGGGMLLTDRQEFADRARYLATQARKPMVNYYEHAEVGYNYRMSNILASVGRGQLRVLDERVQARRAIFAAYRSRLADIEWLRWMTEPNWSFATHWLSACTVEPNARNIKASDIIAMLSDEFVEARPVWKPMQMQPVFSGCRYFPHSEESVSERLYATGICLPSGSNMSEQQLDKVIDTLKRHLRQ